MKFIQLLLLVTVTTSISFAQSLPGSQVPESVKQSFANQFPGHRPSEWARVGNHYETSFRGRKSEIRAAFDGEGNFVKSTEKFSLEYLPEEVKSGLNKNFFGYKPSQVTRSTLAGERPTYHVTVEYGKKYIQAVLDDQGNVLKQEMPALKR